MSCEVGMVLLRLCTLCLPTGAVACVLTRLQVTFNVSDPSFKLDDLLKLELHKFEEEVCAHACIPVSALCVCVHMCVLCVLRLLHPPELSDPQLDAHCTSVANCTLTPPCARVCARVRRWVRLWTAPRRRRRWSRR